MKTAWFILLVITTATCAPAPAGTITGRVHAEGKPGVQADATSGAYTSRALKFAERIDYSELKDFVVYIDGPMTNEPSSPPPTAQVTTTKPTVSQSNAVFSPHVLPVMVGTAVEWPNKDVIFHNVFSYSEARPFDLGLYKDPVVKSVTFTNAGRVDVFCSIHANMSCVVLVVPNRHFAITNGKGVYTIADVPAGTYILKAWHERMPPRSKQITVPATGELKVDFTLGITDLPKL